MLAVRMFVASAVEESQSAVAEELVDAAIVGNEFVVACAAMERGVAGVVVGVKAVVSAFPEELVVSALAVEGIVGRAAVERMSLPLLL